EWRTHRDRRRRSESEIGVLRRNVARAGVGAHPGRWWYVETHWPALTPSAGLWCARYARIASTTVRGIRDLSAHFLRSEGGRSGTSCASSTRRRSQTI